MGQGFGFRRSLTPRRITRLTYSGRYFGVGRRPSSVIPQNSQATPIEAYMREATVHAHTRLNRFSKEIELDPPPNLIVVFRSLP